MPNFNFTEPTLFIEDNGLPFDSLVQDEIKTVMQKNNTFKSEKVKSIYYNKKSDFSAFQTYKLICNRSNWSGKSTSLECPNLDHCGSKNFCVESYLEQV